MAWTDERVDEFKRLLADRLAYSDIAAALGGGLTRNACIGKVKRLGLSNGRPTGIYGRPAKPKEVKPKLPRIRRLTRTISPNHFAIIEMDDELVRELPAAEIPIEQRKQLLELKSHHCRWPHGDVGKADFFFCGAEKVFGSSYCAAHAYISFKPRRILSDEEHARRSASARRRALARKLSLLDGGT